MFIDRAVIEVRSGKGGDGMISFRREKYVPFGGPNGGNGGHGASIYFIASRDENTLIAFRHNRVIIGQDGEKGLTKDRYGRKAEDIYVKVPIGTVVYEEKDHHFLGDLNHEGQTLLVAKGGRGGRGNACFKSSVNKAPKIAENGMPSIKKRLILELKLLADVGIVGFPSVGKSTFLSVVSKAKPEIADYPFTTLIPNLGVTLLKDGRSFVIADLPGLIEGAHQGKGLGLAFLRHAERCRVIIHMIDMSGIRDPYEDYLIIQKELKLYGLNLNKRPMIIVASKMDEDGADNRYNILKSKLKNKHIYKLSSLLNEGIDEILYKAADLLDKTPSFPLFETKDEEKVYLVKRNEENEFLIEKKSEHHFKIYGERIERTYHLINTSTDEGVLKLISYLRKIGVDDELEKMNAKDGDLVTLCDFEFEYVS